MEPRRRMRFALLALILTQCLHCALCGEKLGKWLYRFPYLQLGSHHWVNAHTRFPPPPPFAGIADAKMAATTTTTWQPVSMSFVSPSSSLPELSLIFYLFEFLFDIFLCRWFASGCGTERMANEPRRSGSEFIKQFPLSSIRLLPPPLSYLHSLA